MSAFQKTVLKNGISIVSEDYPSSRAVSCGIWIDTGTRHETPSSMGISHFLEHMVFKGTKTRSAYQIVRELESVGGEINAFTSREHTCFHALSLHENLDLCMDVLADLVCNATFPKSELILEKNVVLQELQSSEDAPEEFVGDVFLEKYFKGSTLGYQILGTDETVKSFNQKITRDYYKRCYVGSKIVVAAAGRLNHEELVKQVSLRLGRIKKMPRKKRVVRARSSTFRDVIAKDWEQVHILFGFPATSFKETQRFEAFILNGLIGGGMSSKLYQKIRENEGLVYSIYSSLSTFSDVGLINIYASAGVDAYRRVVSLVMKELGKIKKQGITASDLSLFKNQVRAAILLGADDVENRMNSIGVNEMVFRRYRAVDEIIAEIDAITLESMHQYIKDHFNLDKISILLMGPVTKEKDLKWLKGLDCK